MGWEGDGRDLKLDYNGTLKIDYENSLKKDCISVLKTRYV